MLEITAEALNNILLKRENDSHKHQYGHLLIVAGSKNMPGAALLATGAALKSGCGLVTLHSCEKATSAAAVRYPSAMLSTDPEGCFSTVPDNLEKYSAIAVGPGLGMDPKTVKALDELMEKAQNAKIPMVIDADALNIMAEYRTHLIHIPEYSVLTPHKKELERLITYLPDENIQHFCNAFKVCLIYKGYHTRIFDPNYNILENTTGNPGMAKGGSGDVLTGLVGGLIARGYKCLDAAGLGA